MKKIFSWGLMAVALTLFNGCSKEEAVEIPETEGNPFALVATPESRTVNEGLNTVWAENDGVNVFHAAAGTTAYTSDGEFTIAAADIEAGKFTGKLGGALNEAAYDWYMFYPYSLYIKTPANTSTGYMAIGSKATDSQTQTGNNSMAHIAGENYPLYGKAVNVAAAAVPSITMHQAAALVAVNVTNPATASDAITVSTVELTAPEDIVGTYYINFAGEEVVYTPSGDTYVSNTAKLDVTNGTALNPGESAKFYLGVKPFDLNNGALTIKVTDGKGMIYEKTTEGLTASFVSGKIKTVNFDLATAVTEQPVINTYTKITTQAELTSGQYLIVYEAGNLAADASKDAKSTGIGANGTNVKVTIENNEIKTSADAFTLTVLDASNGTATIQNTTGSYLNSSSGSNGIVSATAEEKRNCTITVNEDSTVKIANFDATTQFRVNTSNGIFFRFYKNETVTGTTASNYKALCLYKKVE